MRPPKLLSERPSSASVRAYALAVLASVLTAGIALPFHEQLDLANIVMLFLLAVVVVAVRGGRGPAVLASLASVLLFDFLFVPPRFSLAVSHAQYLLTFAVMLAVSLLVSQLTTGLHRQAQEADRRERVARALYDLARELAGAMALSQVEAALRRFLQEHWAAPSRLLVPGAGEELQPVSGEGAHLSNVDLQAARIARDSARPLRSSATADTGRCRHYLPLPGATRNRGVLVVSLAPGEEDIQPLLEAVASLASTAVERLHFVAVAHAAQLETHSERLRSSILAALSHDVRTPLTALYGLADSLLLIRPPLPAEACDTALAIRDQALRVNGMVTNLLDMARLHSGRVSLRKEWQPVEEVVGASLKLLGGALGGHPLRLEGLATLPLLAFDAVLIERVLCNLLENAAKYSPSDAPITLSASTAAESVELQVTSGGEGFPPDRLEQVFGLFERANGDTAVAGMGLGLAICKSIVEAHGGHIRAFNPPSGGACVAFTLPRGKPPAIESEELPTEGESA